MRLREAPGIGLGDPYVDAAKPDARDRGLNLKVSTCRQGKNNDACFDKFKPLFEGEKYVEPLRMKIRMAKAGAARNVSERPFKAASPMKASACPGDFRRASSGPEMGGTAAGRGDQLGIGLAAENEAGAAGGEAAGGGTVEFKKKKGEIPGQPKNIVTATPKKGGYGCLGTTLRPAAFPKKGRQATFERFPEYVHDPEEPRIAARAAARKEERERLAARGAGGAWRPGGGVKSDATRSIVRMNL
ncbi:flagellar associated protein [Monoraphidium neglectum]|uniref:Cilia-and flagella-associated protein 96 n=1 Tax=Monoraphidium neglectum TaxID=145388 RepID=A0A0D2MUB5_9CHLO|nr:flagellar associated protein [Monoraphidium neglectum]KIZ04102.1 flagellar associated protein [Monoraphidium neglectum]|eukprot:XP_013903121.1 flagellar associated protein [Monoraphidium neglectum]